MTEQSLHKQLKWELFLKDVRSLTRNIFGGKVILLSKTGFLKINHVTFEKHHFPYFLVIHCWVKFPVVLPPLTPVIRVFVTISSSHRTNRRSEVTIRKELRTYNRLWRINWKLCQLKILCIDSWTKKNGFVRMWLHKESVLKEIKLLYFIDKINLRGQSDCKWIDEWYC